MSGPNPASAWTRLTHELAYIHDSALHAMRGVRGSLVPARWVGKTVLIGLAYEDDNGAPQRLEQLWGEIADVNAVDGFIIHLKGAHSGQSYLLPPAPSRLLVARRGVYRLKATGEEISDPDFTTAWIVSPPA